jgi:hypothetical protein
MPSTLSCDCQIKARGRNGALCRSWQRLDAAGTRNCEPSQCTPKGNKHATSEPMLCCLAMGAVVVWGVTGCDSTVRGSIQALMLTKTVRKCTV